MKRIYMDNAATTSVAPEVLEQMIPYFTQVGGNPSSIHSNGREAKRALENARRQVAEILGALPQEIYFTSGGSESDNWAIKGAAFQMKEKGKNHIITSAIEHHAVLHTCEWLEKQGFTVTYVPVDEFGVVDLKALEEAISEKTGLISIMAANNEIGTIQPVKEISRIAKEHQVLFHTDAVQAVGAMPIDVNDWQVDMLSLSAHKFRGPKGVGVLYVRKGVRLNYLVHGGAQERGKRAGTENLPGIVGLAAALKRAYDHLDEVTAREKALRDKLINGILEQIPYTRLNGHRENRLPNNVNVSVQYIEGEALLLRLDLAGIAASSGSACTSGSLDPSHVLLAIGLPHEIAHGSLRLTLSDETTEEEVDEVLRVLPNIVNTLRNMSPLYEMILKEGK